MVKPVVAAPAPKAVVDLISTRVARPAQSAPGTAVPAMSSPTPTAHAISNPDGILTPAPAPTPAAPALGEDGTPAEKVLHIKPPIVVKDMAVHLGLKPFQLNRDLMAMEIFASPTQVLEQNVVEALCKKYGFTLEVERREKGAGVHKQEIVVAAPVAPVIVNPEEELKPARRSSLSWVTSTTARPR